MANLDNESADANSMYATGHKQQRHNYGTRGNGSEEEISLDDGADYQSREYLQGINQTGGGIYQDHLTEGLEQISEYGEEDNEAVTSGRIQGNYSDDDSDEGKFYLQ